MLYDAEYVVEFDGIEVNFDRARVFREGREVRLTPSEFQLLTCFLVNAGRDLSRETLLQTVWRDPDSLSTRVVDTHVLRLRQKLEPDPSAPRHFITLHKVGYRFCGNLLSA